MREGCGRERANMDNGENVRPSLARPYIGCTPRDEFPARIASIVTARMKNLCGRLRARGVTRNAPVLVLSSVALRSAATVQWLYRDKA